MHVKVELEAVPSRHSLHIERADRMSRSWEKQEGESRGMDCIRGLTEAAHFIARLQLGVLQVSRTLHPLIPGGLSGL